MTIQSLITLPLFIVLKNECTTLKLEERAIGYYIEWLHLTKLLISNAYYSLTFDPSKSADGIFCYFLWILTRHSPISCTSFILGSAWDSEIGSVV